MNIIQNLTHSDVIWAKLEEMFYPRAWIRQAWSQQVSLLLE
jgi:hypothetical protein